MIIPQTRREAINLYNERAKSKKKKTKYDMFLGGLTCCSDKEFLFHTSNRAFDGTTALIRCQICGGKNIPPRYCTNTTCFDEMETTFSIPWNGGAVG